MLLSEGYFYKESEYVLGSDYGNIECFSIDNISSRYDIVVLPDLIADSYHKDLFSSLEYDIKVGLYMAMNSSLSKVYLMCPISRKKEYLSLFKSLGNVEYVF